MTTDLRTGGTVRGGMLHADTVAGTPLDKSCGGCGTTLTFGISLDAGRGPGMLGGYRGSRPVPIRTLTIRTQQAGR